MCTLKICGLTKIYGKKDNQTKALNDISLEVNKGDMIGIMGRSGCGKSTLLNILGCIDVPDSGEYYIDGDLVDFKRLRNLNIIRNEKISFIFQNFSLIREFSVLDNVIMPLNFRKMANKDRLKLAEKYLEEVGILHLKKKKVMNLSGGEQQRVAIARALCQETDIILADEPTGALDEENSTLIMNILKELNIKYKKTVIIVTHDPIVAGYCENILRMNDGKWVEAK